MGDNLKEYEHIITLCQQFALCLTSNQNDPLEKETRLREMVEPGGRFDQMIDLLKRENKDSLPVPITRDDKPILDSLTFLGGMVGQNPPTAITKRPEADGTEAYKVMIGEEAHNAFLIISLPPDPKIMGISTALFQQVTYSWLAQNG